MSIVLNTKSRVMGDCQARFRERLEVQFLRPTRQYFTGQKALRRMRTIARALVNDLARKLTAAQREPYKDLLLLFCAVITQERHDKNKIYSLHEPDVACISKGKEGKPYEYGNKSSIAKTADGLVVGAMAFEGNPCDGHTLRDQLKQKARRKFRQRAGIEPVIGHLKKDHRMLRNYLKGTRGDAINTMMAAAGYNLRHWIIKREEEITFALFCIIKKWTMVVSLFRRKDRWQIENCFRGMKFSSFNIENTHLIHLERIEQLFGVMIIAFTWAYLVGIKRDIEVKAIRILKTGNRAISIMKYGLEHIARVLLNLLRPQPFDIFKILSCA